MDTPAGSGASLVSGDTRADREFTPDLGGTYTARLGARGVDASSAPCEVSINARPPDELVVEMFWTYPGDDMDLHVLAPGGLLLGSGDCYYGNCQGSSLDWGPTGSAGNPKMVKTDVEGVGEENTWVPNPIADGTYTVVVRDYPNSLVAGANPTTVNVFVRGVLAWTDTRVMDVAEGTYVTFATVDLPAGTVHPCVDTGC